jgi:ribosomal protein L37AE/L43A
MAQSERRGLGNWLRAAFNGGQARAGSPPPKKPRAYNLRKQQLPHPFTHHDWERALDYWGNRCAICGRPRGLWHTLAQDHWVPLTHVACPGTTADNILPLCHGEGGCNNSKGKKEPELWLKEKLGPRRAKKKLYEIVTYFDWAREQASRRLGCPKCGGVVLFLEADQLWHCLGCGVAWADTFAHTMPQCPTCQCWLLPTEADLSQYDCPRCQIAWPEAALSVERCPGCQRGMLQWVATPSESWWHCPACGCDWEDED